MARGSYTIVGLGELLWDLLPAGAQLGGAPSNFAYHAARLGDRAVVASRVGTDAPGALAIDRLKQLGMDASYVQADERHATGTVQVRVDENGQPDYTITQGVAWDFLDYTPQWQQLAAQADAVCFGSLAQRSAQSRNAVQQFLQNSSRNALVIFDVNLRQSFYSKEVLAESLSRARVAKLNDEELLTVTSLLGVSGATAKQRACGLLRAYDLEMVCVTRGGGGSLLVTAAECVEHAGIKVAVADTVGAGDAFAAAVAHYYLRRAPLARISEEANRLAAWVASQTGGMPAAGAAQ